MREIVVCQVFWANWLPFNEISGKKSGYKNELKASVAQNEDMSDESGLTADLDRNCSLIHFEIGEQTDFIYKCILIYIGIIGSAVAIIEWKMVLQKLLWGLFLPPISHAHPRAAEYYLFLHIHYKRVLESDIVIIIAGISANQLSLKKPNPPRSEQHDYNREQGFNAPSTPTRPSLSSLSDTRSGHFTSSFLFLLKISR